MIFQIIWDEPKRAANLAKHGLDFADLTEAFFENAIFLPANKPGRWRGIGLNIDGVICVVFARYGREAISVMSMRPASLIERKHYNEQIHQDQIIQQS